jgi:hypothetical protein
MLRGELMGNIKPCVLNAHPKDAIRKTLVYQLIYLRAYGIAITVCGMAH